MQLGERFIWVLDVVDKDDGKQGGVISIMCIIVAVHKPQYHDYRRSLRTASYGLQITGFITLTTPSRWVISESAQYIVML